MTPGHVIVAAGSRRAKDASLVAGALTVLYHQHPGAVLYAGDAGGADELFAACWARLCGYPGPDAVEDAVLMGRVIRFTADWEHCTETCSGPGHRRYKRHGHGATYCPAAGPRRNDAMCAAAAEAGCPVTTITLIKAGVPNNGTRGCARAMSRHHLPDPVVLTEEPS
jgi:hypothetical protein